MKQLVALFLTAKASANAGAFSCQEVSEEI